MITKQTEWFVRVALPSTSHWMVLAGLSACTAPGCGSESSTSDEGLSENGGAAGIAGAVGMGKSSGGDASGAGGSGAGGGGGQGPSPGGSTTTPSAGGDGGRNSAGGGTAGAPGGGGGDSDDGGAAGAGDDGAAGEGNPAAAGSGGEADSGAGQMPSGMGVTIDGTTLTVDGEPFHIRGVGWNPVPRGQTHPAGLDYAGFASVDIPLMESAGINAVRTYEPILDAAVLDQLYAAGIYVLNSIYPYGGDPPSVVVARVDAVRDHPAMLMWLLGNEWNYNGLYVDLAHDDALAQLNEAAALVRMADGTHPIATVYGELPSAAVIDAMPDVDVWGINAYRGISFGSLFDDWRDVSDKPMFMAEYGADAYNANEGEYDPESQAEAVSTLTLEIANHGSAFGAGAALGGAVFEWADEWWKDPDGSLDAQDVGGIAPGGGPHPDQVFNEEWWGIVDIDRNPRPAYDALVDVFAELR